MAQIRLFSNDSDDNIAFQIPPLSHNYRTVDQSFINYVEIQTSESQ
jgi:hypothetical protein